MLRRSPSCSLRAMFAHSQPSGARVHVSFIRRIAPREGEDEESEHVPLKGRMMDEARRRTGWMVRSSSVGRTTMMMIGVSECCQNGGERRERGSLEATDERENGGMHTADADATRLDLDLRFRSPLPLGSISEIGFTDRPSLR